MRVFLSGPMGSGKSTVGRLLSGKLSLPFIDLDSRIEEETGKSIPVLFQSAGEPEFRRIEAELLSRVLDERAGGVVALGGGACMHQGLRHRMLFEGVLVTLMAAPDVLARRLSRDDRRPLLAGKDPASALAGILAARRLAYAECHATVDVGALSTDEAVDRVLAVVRDAPIAVPLGERTYRVSVGRGVLAKAREGVAGATSVLVVSDENTRRPWGENVGRAAAGAVTEARVTHVPLPAGEAHKHIGSVERIWDAALRAGADRQSCVLAVGGGVVGDVAGFAAATLLRGVAVGQVPTTVVAMVDSAVGGKTGIDRAEGKNLVGAFHQPRFVLADLDALATLPREERVAGLAEVAKSAWLAGEPAVALVESRAEALRDGDLDAFAEVVRMAVQLKARIVGGDETEQGDRALLNLGHTVGHGLEAASGYRLRHGEAVALGLMAAFEVEAHVAGEGAAAAGGARATRERMGALLSRLGLPTDWRGAMSEAVLSFMGADKKRVGGDVRFVMPRAPGRAELQRIPLGALHAAVRGGA